MKKIFKINNGYDINKMIYEISHNTSELGFDRFEVNKIILALLEMTTNTIKHANGGIVQFRTLPKKNGIEILIEDFGEGIANIEKAQQKGYSTIKGSLGLGFHITRKIIDEFDISSKPGEGTEVIIRHYLSIPIEKIEYGISTTINKNDFYSCYRYIKEVLHGDTVLFGIINGTLVNKKTSAIINNISEVITFYKTHELKVIVAKCNELIRKAKYMENLHYGLVLLKPDQIEYISFGKIFIKIIDLESNLELFNQSGIVGKSITDDLNVVKQLVCSKVMIGLSTFDYKFNILNIETSDSAQKISEIIIDDLCNDHFASSVLVLKRKGVI